MCALNYEKMKNNAMRYCNAGCGTLSIRYHTSLALLLPPTHHLLHGIPPYTCTGYGIYKAVVSATISCAMFQDGSNSKNIGFIFGGKALLIYFIAIEYKVRGIILHHWSTNHDA